MAGHSKDPLLQLSAALASATASAQSSVVAIRAPRSPPLSGTLWRNNLVVASEQVFPRADAAEIVQTDGAAIRARVAGRDPGTNIVALQLESPIEFDRPEPADPALGALVLTFLLMPGAHRWCVSGSCARSGLPGIAAAAGASTGGSHLISTSPAARKGVPSSTLPALCSACRPPARAAARLSSRLRLSIVSSRRSFRRGGLHAAGLGRHFIR